MQRIFEMLTPLFKPEAKREYFFFFLNVDIICTNINIEFTVRELF